MKQDNVDQMSEQIEGKSNLSSTQEYLTLEQNNLKVNLQETDENELELPSQRRPQFRINENSRRRF